MEDFYETRIDGVDGEVVGLFGVFDGISLFLLLSKISPSSNVVNMEKYYSSFSITF